MKKILLSLIAAMTVMPAMSETKTTRHERNYIVEGNKLSRKSVTPKLRSPTARLSRRTP